MIIYHYDLCILCSPGQMFYGFIFDGHVLGVTGKTTHHCAAASRRNAKPTRTSLWSEALRRIELLGDGSRDAPWFHSMVFDGLFHGSFMLLCGSMDELVLSGC